jgi:hypothetical protein
MWMLSETIVQFIMCLTYAMCALSVYVDAQ